MSTRLNWMPLYVRDYDESTDHLTCEQDGAYGRLLRRMWIRGDLPNDDGYLANACGVTRTHWVRHIKPVLMPMMLITDTGTISQKRLQKEREKAAKISAIRSDAAKQKSPKTTDKYSIISNEFNDGIVAIATPDERTNGEQVPQQLLVHTQEDKEESKKEHKPSVYDAVASPTLFDDIQKPVAKSKLAPHPVWSEGLEILGWVANRVRPEDRNEVVKLLRKCQQSAGGDDDMLIDVLRTVRQTMNPARETIGVIKSMLSERGGVPLKNRPRLVIDNNDPQGIQAWCRSISGVKPTGDGDREFGNWAAYGCIVDVVAVDVARAAELPTPCRMDWSLLSTWLSDGLEPDFIIRRVKENVAWLSRKGSYAPPSSLALFDAFIRGARKSA